MLSDTRLASAYRYIEKFEDTRLKMYRCPGGYLTIGVGHNLETTPITIEASIQIFRDDTRECVRDLGNIFTHWESISWARQLALIDIRFNLGSGGFRKFRKMIQAVRDENWVKVSEQLLYKDPHVEEKVHSKYYFDVKGRAITNARVLRGGSLE